jgi:hypothetical protein
MPDTLVVDEALDLFNNTLPELNPMKMVQVAQTLQDYPFQQRLMRRDRVVLSGGDYIDVPVMYKGSGQAKFVGLGEKRSAAFADTTAKGRVDWTHSTWYWGVPDDRMLKMNSGRHQIYDLLNLEREKGRLANIEMLEAAGWSKPDDSTDKKTLFGIPMWVTHSGTEGFNGPDPAGFPSGTINLSRTTYPMLSNYTGTYSAVTKGDLVMLMRRAKLLTGFKSPIGIMDFRFGRGDRMRIFCGQRPKLQFETLGENQNESLGRDLATMDGQIVFHGSPIEYVPYLDADTTDPVYMLNFDFFQTYIMEGEFQNERPAIRPSDQPRTIVVWVDSSHQTICVNPRTQAYFRKSA